MVRAIDVAAFIERERGRFGEMKRQKLLYYSQAWSLVWDGAALFDEPIEAWADGPVVDDVWGTRRSDRDGNPDAMTSTQEETVREVLRIYGRHSGSWLSALTHREPPWADARAGAAPRDRSRVVIEPAAMRDYYGRQGMPPKKLSEPYYRGLRLRVALREADALSLFDMSNTISGPEALKWLRDG